MSRSLAVRSRVRLIAGAGLAVALLTTGAYAVPPDAVGGGYLDAGLLGEYFANPDLSGTPVFTRRDVRLDYDWGDLLPIGGSRYVKLRTFPRDSFSVRWTGRLMPRFSETYAFRAVFDEGLRVRIRQSGASTWTTVIDQWNAAGALYGTAQALTAGTVYEIQVEYRDLTGPAMCRLYWSSHSTPDEVIDPVAMQALNATSYTPYMWADHVKDRRWGDTTGLDTLGWPRVDNKEFVLGEMDGSDWELWGTYRVSFKGKARVTTGCCNHADLIVGATNYQGDKPRDAGYDPATNTTTFLLRSDGSRLFPRFSQTSRAGGDSAGDGITELVMMRPVAPYDSSCHDSSEVIYRPFKALASGYYTCLRWLQGANGNTDSVWNDRTRPAYAFFAREKAGVTWSDQENWEYLVMLANETGKDLYLTLPIKACDDYFTKLANLLRYGSDGNQLYTSPRADPEYPPLNPNLRVYMEVGNEIWNWSFVSTQTAGRCNRAESAAVSPLWNIVNYDGRAGNASWAPAIRRWLTTRTVGCSNAFRAVWGDAAMGPRVRMLCEYQYDNAQETASRSFEMFEQYYNNGFGDYLVADPHPASYYLWGAGGATYYGVGSPVGHQSAILVPDSGFETPVVAARSAQVRPSGSAWTFTGNSGIFRQDIRDSTIAGVGTPDTAPEADQGAFIIDTGSISTTVNFTQTGWFAVNFNACGEGGYWPGYLSFSIYYDTTNISPKGQADDRLSRDGRVSLTGWNRNTAVFSSEYGSMVFQVTTTGNHTIRFAGRETNGRQLYLDNIRIASVDTIMESGFGSGQAAGQVADSNYQKQLYSQAKYARTFGLNVISYEAGWSLGGDFTQRPVQNWCKYHDSRARRINDTAEAIWRRSGSAMQVWGVYAYWPPYSIMDVDSFPLMQSLQDITDSLSAECVNGKLVPCTLRGIYQTDDVSWSYGNRNQLRKRGDWASWLFVAPERGDYSLKVYGRQTGAYRIEVDGDTIGSAASAAGTITFQKQLIKGGHAVRVADMRDTVTIDSIEITYTPLSVAGRPVTMDRETVRAPASATAGWGIAAASPAVVSGTTSPAVEGPVEKIAEPETQQATVQVAWMGEQSPSGTVAPAQSKPAVAAVRGDGYVPPLPVAPERQARNMRWSGDRPSLPVVAVSASSSQNANPVAGVMDGDLRTRWAPEGAGQQWLQLDLGAAREVRSVSLVWFSPRRVRSECVVAVSVDGQTYAPVSRVALAGRGTQRVQASFSPAVARFVRVAFPEQAASRLSVYEAAVHGDDRQE